MAAGPVARSRAQIPLRLCFVLSLLDCIFYMPDCFPTSPNMNFYDQIVSFKGGQPGSKSDYSLVIS